jgi:hypothetical protein
MRVKWGLSHLPGVLCQCNFNATRGSERTHTQAGPQPCCIMSIIIAALLQVVFSAFNLQIWQGDNYIFCCTWMSNSYRMSLSGFLTCSHLSCRFPQVLSSVTTESLSWGFWKELNFVGEINKQTEGPTQLYFEVLKAKVIIPWFTYASQVLLRSYSEGCSSSAHWQLKHTALQVFMKTCTNLNHTSEHKLSGFTLTSYSWIMKSIKCVQWPIDDAWQTSSKLCANYQFD